MSFIENSMVNSLWKASLILYVLLLDVGPPRAPVLFNKLPFGAYLWANTKSDNSISSELTVSMICLPVLMLLVIDRISILAFLLLMPVILPLLSLSRKKVLIFLNGGLLSNLT